MAHSETRLDPTCVDGTRNSAAAHEPEDEIELDSDDDDAALVWCLVSIAAASLARTVVPALAVTAGVIALVFG